MASPAGGAPAETVRSYDPGQAAQSVRAGVDRAVRADHGRDPAVGQCWLEQSQPVLPPLPGPVVGRVVRGRWRRERSRGLKSA